MNRNASPEGADGGLSAAWGRLVLRTGLTVWLAGYCYWSEVTTFRTALLLCVLPGVLWKGRALWAVVRRERWVWLLLLLLLYQCLSRLRAGADFGPHGYWLDVVMVMTLLAGVLAISRSPDVEGFLVPWLGAVAAIVAAVSLFSFYGDPQHTLADDRLRNMLIYEDGLNAVLTGMLFAFGALLVLWMTVREDDKRRRAGWLVALAVLIGALLATQSRGAMLAYGIGFAVLAVVERRRIVPAFGVCAGTTLGYFFLLMISQAGGAATRDLLGRGATGRFDIYAWFLQRMEGADVWIGKGMGAASFIPAEELGWYVDHPHSVFVAQYYLTGAVGLGLLLGILSLAGRAALTLAGRGEALWLALLGGFGVALLFDGGQLLSLYSVGRLEPLLLLVPAAMAVGRAPVEERRLDERGGQHLPDRRA